MMFGTYCRLDLHAMASNCDAIKAMSRKMFRPEVRFGRENRDLRHRVYRDLIKTHAEARELFQSVTSGNVV